MVQKRFHFKYIKAITDYFEFRKKTLFRTKGVLSTKRELLFSKIPITFH